MLKIFLSLIAMLYAAVCLAGTDVNKANAAELDSIKGIGPALSGKILDERKKGNFKDWNDLLARVKGMGQKNAAKFSAQGLTVDEAVYKEGSAAPATDSVKK
ncbi:MAG: helix-hairpin-helix domain-containing protein [Comamonadaceae bacterium]